MSKWEWNHSANDSARVCLGCVQEEKTEMRASVRGGREPYVHITSYAV